MQSTGIHCFTIYCCGIFKFVGHLQAEIVKKKRVFYIFIYSLIEISVIKIFQIHVAVSCISIKMFTKADKSDLLFIESDCGVLLEVT